MFYEGDQTRLRKHVDKLLEDAESVQLPGDIKGLVSPHAGYVYSGLAAAVGYKALRGLTYDAVIMVGPSHREFFDGASLCPGDAFRTPLGDVAINKEIRDSLATQSELLTISDTGHRNEHCLEVQLPFLQRVLGDFTFVPIVIGNQRHEICLAVGDAIAKVAATKNILLVASSDLSHYHPYNAAVGLDRQVIDRVESFDENEMMRQVEGEKIEACGGGPIVTVMRASRLLGANRAQALYYCNSGDISGDRSAVVGYLSAAFLQVH
jgi:hypothetical protein